MIFGVGQAFQNGCRTNISDTAEQEKAMMGYTHAAIGAGGALAAALALGYATPEAYLLAVTAGALGGIAPDVDVKDNAKVKDGTRSRIAALVIVFAGLVLGQLFGYGTLSAIFQRRYLALAGLLLLVALLVAGHFTEHRTFTHSLLFAILTTACVYAVLPVMSTFYLLGCLLHIVLDMLNNRFNQHGVWLFYPLRVGKGIAFGLCKAARTGNKVFCFVGIAICVIASIGFMSRLNGTSDYIVLLGTLLVLIASLHFARVKSEKEQRHLMHINGELK